MFFLLSFRSAVYGYKDIKSSWSGQAFKMSVYNEEISVDENILKDRVLVRNFWG